MIMKIFSMMLENVCQKKLTKNFYIIKLSMIDEDMDRLIKRIFVCKANKSEIFRPHYFENQIINNTSSGNIDDIINNIHEYEIVSPGYMRFFRSNSNSDDFEFNELTSGFKVPKKGLYKLSLVMLCCETRSVSGDPLTIYLDKNGDRTKLIRTYKNCPYLDDELDVYYNEILIELDEHIWYNLFMTANLTQLNDIDGLNNVNSNTRQLIVATEFSKLTVTLVD